MTLLDMVFGERRAVKQSLGHPSSGILGLFNGANDSGQVVNEETAIGYSGVWAASNKISGALSVMPKKVFEKIEGGGRKESDSPLNRLISSEPNADMDASIYWDMMIGWWMNLGNAFSEIVRDGAGRPVALWPIHPTRVEFTRLDNGDILWGVINNSGPDTPIPDDDMLNLVGPFSNNGIIGRGIFEVASQSIGIGLANENTQASFYANNMQPAGILMHDSKLTPTARDNIRREWSNVHGGTGNKGKIAVLWEGMTYSQTGANPDDAKLIEAAEFRITDMARWYDLPPHVLKDLTRATFSNIDSQQISLIVDSYLPKIIKIEQALNRKLLTEPEKGTNFIKFIVDAFLRGDPKVRAEVNKIKLQNGAMSINEWRKQDELEPLPPDEGDVFFMPLNISTVTKIVAEDEPEQIEKPEETEGDADVEEVIAEAERNILAAVGVADVKRLTEMRNHFDLQATLIEKKLGESPVVENTDSFRRDETLIAMRNAIDDVVNLMIGKESDAAKRFAKSPSDYMKKLDEFYENHNDRFKRSIASMVKAYALAADIEDNDLAGEMIKRSHEQSYNLLIEACECDQDKLIESVTRCVDSHEFKTRNLISKGE